MNYQRSGRKIRPAIALAGVAVAAIGMASAGTASAATPHALLLCPPLPQALCDILGGGGSGGGTPALPGGVTTADPTSFPDTATAQSVTLTDPLATIYSTLTSGATVQLVGSGTTAGQVVDGVVGTISGNSIPVTFNLDAGAAPLGPGSYSIVTSPAVLSGAGLGTLLSGLGLSALPLDTASVTVSAGAPAPIAAVTVKPGGSANLSVATTGAPFATGDAVSITSTAGAVSGLNLTNTKVSSSSISATLTAAASVPLGSYNLVVTDTSGQSGKCSGCVAVSNSAPTTLTMTAAHSHLTSGAHLTLSGQLSTAAGKGLGSKSIGLYLKNVGTKAFSPLTTLTTSSSGRFSHAFAPKRNAVYVAYFAGDATAAASDLAALSPVRTVTVARAVTLHVKVAHASSKHAKHPLTATGKVKPSAAGRVVKLYDGKRKLGSAKVTKKGTFKIKVKSLKAGKHALRAKVAKQTAYAAGASKVVHKTVK